MEAVLTIWPPSPWLWSSGRNAFKPCTTPIRLTSIVQRQSCSEILSDAAGAAYTGVIAQHMHFAEGIDGGLRGALDVGISRVHRTPRRAPRPDCP